MSKVVGIDLGTTNSLVAYVKDGVPVVIRDRSGDGLVPSVVSAAGDGTIYVGREAQRRLLTDANRTVYSVKRFMGKGLDDVQDEARLFPVPHRGRRRERGPDRPGRPRIHAAGDLGVHPARAEAPRRGVLRRAGRGRSRSVDRAVITVPAYFNDAQRTADARRRPDRRPRRPAHHQRADRGVAGLRPRQAPHRPDRRLRFRRRDVRHLDPARRGRRLPGALDQRRHAPRRRRHRSGADRPGARGSRIRFAVVHRLRHQPDVRRVHANS